MKKGMLSLCLLLTCSHMTAVFGASAVKTRVLGPESLLIEVSSDAPVMRPSDGYLDGYFESRIEGMSSLRAEGRPGMPFRTVLVGVPEGKTVALESSSDRPVTLGSYRLAPVVQAPAGGPFDGGSEMPTFREVEQAESEFLAAFPDVYPATIAEIHGIGVLRDQRVAEIRVYPVQYGTGQQEVIHHGRITLIVRFVDAGAEEALSVPRIDPAGSGPASLFEGLLRRTLVNYDMIRPDRARRRTASPAVSAMDTEAVLSSSAAMAGASGAVKIFVKQDGAYGVEPQDLTSAGVDVSLIDPQTFHMSAGGIDVPILVEGEGDATFDPGDRVIFYGTSIKGNRYNDRNVYWLTFGGTAGPRMSSRSGALTTTGSTPGSFMTTAHVESNLMYTSRIRPGVDEKWFWRIQPASSDPNLGAFDYTVDLPGLSPIAHTVDIRARMLGLTGGDHTPRLLVNGTQVAEQTFNGQVLYSETASTPSAGLLAGSNTFRLWLTNNGNFASQIASDYFEVDYRRTYTALSGSLQFDGEDTGTNHFVIGNLDSNDLVLLDIADPANPQSITIPGGQITGGPAYSATFEDLISVETPYLISGKSSLLTPQGIELDIPSNLSSPSNGADHIIITDRALLAALQPLAAHRQAQGMRVALVATDDIYDEFDFGRPDPNAIRTFLGHALSQWTAPAPTYVLLAGDGHVDFTDNLGTGTPQIIPPILSVFPGIGEAPSDNEFVSLVGGDTFPEMIIGRLPIRTPGDAAIMVSNVIDYETSPPVSALNQQSLFVADNNDVIFQAMLNNLTFFMPPTMAAATAYLPGGDPNNPPSQPDVDATTDLVFGNLNSGALLTTYLGHGNVALWAKEKIVEHNPNPVSGPPRLDVDRVSNTGNMTFLLALNCINGYFADFQGAGPGHVDYSLAEEFMRHPGGGAIAVWAPSSLGLLSEYDGIAYEIYNHLFVEGVTALGPAAVTAVTDAVGTFGIDPINIDGMIFFGDPAVQWPLDSDVDGLVDHVEIAAGSSPYDEDTDDDGVGDAMELTALSTSPVLADTDGDGLLDGTEIGLTAPLAGTDVSAGFFIPDADPSTTTDPGNPDSDSGGIPDGDEDADHDGLLSMWESDPNDGSDDAGCHPPLLEVSNVDITVSGDDLVISWDPVSPNFCVIYRVVAAVNNPAPKSSATPFFAAVDTFSTSITIAGAGTDPDDYDIIVIVAHPTFGMGPYGHFGL